MNTKRYILSSLAGGIANWLLGFIFYGLLFSTFFPSGENMNLLLVTCGSFTMGFFIAYLYNGLTQITSIARGAKVGATVGLLTGLFYNFFYWAEKSEVNLQLFALDVGITVIMLAITGGVVALVSGKVN